MCYNSGNPDDRYKYSSKELETVGSLDKYHYGFREYDPEIGRWNRVDPLYYQTPGRSPYGFVANDPINKYDVAGLYDFYSLGEMLYEQGDTGHTLAMKMMAWLGLGAYSDTWNNLYDASVGGSAGFSRYAGSGSSYLAIHPNSRRGRYVRRMTYDEHEVWYTPLINEDGEYLRDEDGNILLYRYEWYENLRYELVWVGNDIEDSNTDGFWGPPANENDSWLWRAFRGTGNIKEDIFNASMLSLMLPVATIGAAEATAYIAAEAPYLAAGWQAASAEMYSGWATITKTGNLIVNAIKTQITATTIEALNRYYANATNIHDASNSYIAGLFRLNYKPVTKYGYYGKFAGILTKKFIKSIISLK